MPIPLTRAAVVLILLSGTSWALGDDNPDAPHDATFQQIEDWCKSFATKHPTGKPLADFVVAQAHLLAAAHRTEKLKASMNPANLGERLPNLSPSEISGTLAADPALKAEDIKAHHQKALMGLQDTVKIFKRDENAIPVYLNLGRALQLGTACGLWAIPGSDVADKAPNPADAAAVAKAMKEVADPKKAENAVKTIMQKHLVLASWLAHGGDKDLSAEQLKAIQPALDKYWGLEAVKRYEVVYDLALAKSRRQKNQPNPELVEAGKAIVAIIDNLGMQKEYKNYANAKKASELPVFDEVPARN